MYVACRCFHCLCNCRAVHDILGDLKAQARAMGTEIDDQNEMIQEIDAKAQSNDERVKAAELRAARILKSTCELVELLRRKLEGDVVLSYECPPSEVTLKCLCDRRSHSG